MASMFGNSRRTTRHGRDRSTVHRGAASLFALAVVLVIMALVGAILELALIYHVHLQLQRAADTAALAGAVELLDEDLLRPGNRPNQRDDVAQARRAAVAYAGANSAAAMPIDCDPNIENDPDGDLVVGWIDNPGHPGSPLVPWNSTAPANSLEVKLRRTAATGNPVPLWFTSILGLTDADVEAIGRASVDRRVFGFRPTRESNVPLVPLAVARRGGRGWFDQAFAPAVPSTNDQYRVDESTGAITRGPDGIPEVVLRSASPADPSVPGNAGLLLLDRAGNTVDVARQIVAGLEAEDLNTLGGAFALGPDGTLALPGQRQIPRQIAEALAKIRGTKHVWPLYRGERDLGSLSVYELDGFAAGRVLDVNLDADGRVTVVVQPCLMVESTALVGTTRFGPELNVWIAKLLIAR